MKYDCDIIANNESDFIVSKNITSGKVPVLLGAGNSADVSDLNFDIDECCSNNDSFRVWLKKAETDLRATSSLAEKFEVMQNFFEKTMPLCDPKHLEERTYCLFDGEPFSYMVKEGYCMCAERATMAQYLCQQCGINSYLVNSRVNISNGENGLHAYVVFEQDGHMYVYDPANPTEGDHARIMDTNMDKQIFNDFMDAVNENADSLDIKKKNCVGFVCQHEDGKKFLYRSYCGTNENRIGPKKLKEARNNNNLATTVNIEAQLN